MTATHLNGEAPRVRSRSEAVSDHTFAVHAKTDLVKRVGALITRIVSTAATINYGFMVPLGPGDLAT